MFIKRSWQLVTKVDRKYFFNSIVRAENTLSHSKIQSANKFSFNSAVKLLDKRYNEMDRVVRFEPDSTNYREPIFVFPGFEGRFSSMLPFIENIGRPALCLQYPFEGSPTFTHETAAILLPQLENCTDPAQRVNILAHSFGGLIALDVIKLLESKGRQVRLCLTDSSPYALKIFGLNAFGDVYSDDFETNMVIFLLNSLCTKNINQFNDIIESSLTFGEKVEILSPMLTSLCPLDCDEIKLFFNGLFNLSKSMLIYDENFAKLKCQATLIRPDIRIWEFPDDYKISKHFEKPVSTFFTDGHHVSMLKSKNTVALINKIFDE